MCPPSLSERNSCLCLNGPAEGEAEEALDICKIALETSLDPSVVRHRQLSLSSEPRWVGQFYHGWVLGRGRALSALSPRALHRHLQGILKTHKACFWSHWPSVTSFDPYNPTPNIIFLKPSPFGMLPKCSEWKFPEFMAFIWATRYKTTVSLFFRYL